MYYVKCGRSFLRRNRNGKYILTKNILFADGFDSEWEAKRVINNNISPRERKKYCAVYHDEKTENPDISITNAASAKTVENLIEKLDNIDTAVDSDRLQDIKSEVERIKQFAENSEQRIIELNFLLSDVDKEIVDIQHYIELSDLDETECYPIYNMLRGKFRKRRKIKNEMYILGQVKGCQIDTSSMGALLTVITQIETQKYTPRKLTELFKDMNGSSGKVGENYVEEMA